MSFAFDAASLRFLRPHLASSSIFSYMCMNMHLPENPPIHSANASNSVDGPQISGGKKKCGDPNQLEIFVACAAVTGKYRDLDQACVLAIGVL